MDTAGFGELDHLAWTTEFTNQATGTEFQAAEYDRGTWYRVVRYGREVVAPRRNRGDVLRRYQRFIRRTPATK
jgi:hypothetical protein